MSTNNHALVRYRAIDRCLKSNGTYHLKDLIKVCTEEVSAYQERIARPPLSKPISKRTLLYDLTFMKDDIDGFGAPIVSDRIDGYFYDDPTFEIFKAKIRKTDLEELKYALLSLRKVSGGGEFRDLESAITRIEETYSIKGNRKVQAVISFEHSTNISGQQWINQLKSVVQKKEVIAVEYQPFGDETSLRIFSPYLIKEYNNRWFLIGYDHDKKRIQNLGLDRIQSIAVRSLLSFVSTDQFRADDYLKDIVGVSIPDTGVKEKIVIKAYHLQRYYIDTKPIHMSQKVLEMSSEFGIFSIDVIPNYELKSKILAYGNDVEVLEPLWLRQEMRGIIEGMVGRYE